ncbi:hypothetical protein SOHN41_01005 [Shewanella sp. HN-41]|nr:hypothetical protein SOHN41_01005 [Shewanella sp. HN-41]
MRESYYKHSSYLYKRLSDKNPFDTQQLIVHQSFNKEQINIIEYE